MLVIADDARRLGTGRRHGRREQCGNGCNRPIFSWKAHSSIPIRLPARRVALGFPPILPIVSNAVWILRTTRAALERATALILEICGGTAVDVVEVHQRVAAARSDIVLRAERARRVLGIDLSAWQICCSAAPPALRFQRSRAGHYSVTPPSYRFDLAIEADLIEELARLHGYDNIPALPPAQRLAPAAAAGSSAGA